MALKECKALGMELASIESKEEDAELIEFMTGYFAIYLISFSYWCIIVTSQACIPTIGCLALILVPKQNITGHPLVNRLVISINLALNIR
jgi:hypothetical protein